MGIFFSCNSVFHLVGRLPSGPSDGWPRLWEYTLKHRDIRRYCLQNYDVKVLLDLRWNFTLFLGMRVTFILWWMNSLCIYHKSHVHTIALLYTLLSPLYTDKPRTHLFTCVPPNHYNKTINPCTHSCFNLVSSPS